MKQPPHKKSTIYDVAAKAGASVATVSRVLSKSGYPVREELRRRIREAAESLSYSPNMVGRMLKNSASTDIGIVIPTISNPYYATLCLGAELEARKEGFSLFLCNSLRDKASERKYIESLFQKQVRGIMISSIGGNIGLLEEIKKYGMKIVAFDQDSEQFQCSRVCFDYARGARMAVKHLADSGHRRIAFLSAPMNRQSRRDILGGYRQAMAECGIPPDESHIVVSETEEELQTGAYEFQNGKRLASMFLDLPERPTAILAVNDLTAVGVMRGLADRGVRVPDDVSVIGFDNIELSAMVSPPLTTISQPAFETGRLACRVLLDGLNGESSDDVTMLLQPTLISRQSVRDIRI